MRFPACEWRQSTPAQLEPKLELALATAGYFILEEVLPKEKVSSLFACFKPLFNTDLATSVTNRGAFRHSMHLPFEAPYADPEILINPLLLPLFTRLLGEKLECTYFSSDTAMPGSEYQDVHADGPWLFPELPSPLPTYALALNIPLVDVGLENGPMEVWPSTHLLSSPSPIDGARLFEPEKVLMPAGSFLVRHLRMWHRGTPNRSREMRPNLAFVFARHWYQLPNPMTIRIRETIYGDLPPAAQHLFRGAQIAPAGADRLQVVEA